MPRKNLAKMAAALEACKKLHEIGELDDNLLPVRSLSDEESELEDEDKGVSGKKRKKGGPKKQKRVYERKVKAKIQFLTCSDKDQHHRRAGQSCGPKTLCWIARIALSSHSNKTNKQYCHCFEW